MVVAAVVDMEAGSAAVEGFMVEVAAASGLVGVGSDCLAAGSVRRDSQAAEAPVPAWLLPVPQGPFDPKARSPAAPRSLAAPSTPSNHPTISSPRAVPMDATISDSGGGFSTISSSTPRHSHITITRRIRTKSYRLSRTTRSQILRRRLVPANVSTGTVCRHRLARQGSRRSVWEVARVHATIARRVHWDAPMWPEPRARPSHRPHFSKHEKPHGRNGRERQSRRLARCVSIQI